MGDIRNPKLLYLKAALFLLLGVVASVGLIVLHPTLTAALLLAVAVWAFARAYYFAFYVIEHYIDPRFKFAGLLSVARYLMERKKSDPPSD